MELLTRNADPDKYGYSGYGIKLNARPQFLLSNGKWGKHIVISGVNKISPTHIDNRKKKS